MEDLQQKYIQTNISSQGYLYCSGDEVYYSLSIHTSKIRSFNIQMKEIYKHLVSKLTISLKTIDTNFALENISNEISFLNYNFDNNENGTINFKYDISFYWFNYIENSINEIWLPRGCKISIYKNDKLDYPLHIVLRFYFNLFSNNLLSVATYGKYEKELYYFKPAARINRAIVRNIILELKFKHPEIEIEFSNEIGWLTNFDEFGFTEETDYVFD